MTDPATIDRGGIDPATIDPGVIDLATTDHGRSVLVTTGSGAIALGRIEPLATVRGVTGRRAMIGRGVAVNPARVHRSTVRDAARPGPSGPRYHHRRN